MKIDKLKKEQTDVQREKSNLVAKLDQLDKLTTAEKSKFTKISQDILTQEKYIRSAVYKDFQKLRNELDQGRQIALKSIESDQNTMSVSVKLVEDKKNEVKELIQMTDATKFFSNVKLMEKAKTFQTPHTKSTYGSTPIFVPGEITQYNVGIIQSDQTSSVEPIVGLNINRQYQTELSMISFISPCLDNSLWISSESFGELQKVTSVVNGLQVIDNVNIKVFGMAVLSSGDILLSTGETRVQQLNVTTGKLSDSVYNVEPLVAEAIHITSENKVVVGGKNDTLRRCAVFVMNVKGQHKTVFEHHQQDQPIFTYYNPHCITSTRNGNIHVIDYGLGSDRGRLVVLGQGGDIINTYSGKKDINKNIPLRPVSIVTTPRDNVIVVDLDTNYLHILTNAGQPIMFYCTKDIGIEHPISLAFTPTGQLFIECTKPKGATTKEAKLYEVNISGC